MLYAVGSNKSYCWSNTTVFLAAIISTDGYGKVQVACSSSGIENDHCCPSSFCPAPAKKHDGIQPHAHDETMRRDASIVRPTIRACDPSTCEKDALSPSHSAAESVAVSTSSKLHFEASHVQYGIVSSRHPPRPQRDTHTHSCHHNESGRLPSSVRGRRARRAAAARLCVGGEQVSRISTSCFFFVFLFFVCYFVVLGVSLFYLCPIATPAAVVGVSCIATTSAANNRRIRLRRGKSLQAVVPIRWRRA